MTRLPLLAVLAACACSGDAPVPDAVDPAVVDVATGPPDAPAHPSGPGTFQVAWTTELSEANRVGPPIPAGATVEVVAVSDGVAAVRTQDDPPRAGKMPVHHLITGTRMQPGITTAPAQLMSTLEADAGETVPPLSLVLPYQARDGRRAVIGPDGEPRWILGSVLTHDPGELAMGEQIAAVRWSQRLGDEEGARRRVRSLPVFVGPTPVYETAMALYSTLLGEQEAFKLVDDRVHDPESGLSWRRCADGQGWDPVRGGCDGVASRFPLDRADAACGTFRSEDGAWRLPSVEEFQSVMLCAAGVGADGACAEPQLTAALVPAFQTPPERMWTRDVAADGKPQVVDLSTGEVVGVGPEETAGTLCVTETFDGNTYFQTAGETRSARSAADLEQEAGDVDIELLEAGMLYLTEMPAHVDEDEIDDLVVQLRTPQGVRWVAHRDLKEPAFPLQAVPIEGVRLPENALMTGDCLELYGPSDRITAGEDLRVVEPGATTGTLWVEVERACKGSSGLTFRNISTVEVGGAALRVRTDAEDPCRDIGSRIPTNLRENLVGRLPNHPALCAEWRFEEQTVFFPGAEEQYRAFLDQDVVVEASAFTGYVVDGQLISAAAVEAESVFRGGAYNLVVATEDNAVRRTSEVVVYRASLYAWSEVTRRLATGGGPRDEMFTFDAETGELIGSMGLRCTYDDAARDYVCE